MTDITSVFNNPLRIGSTNMNASGQFVACQTSTLPYGQGWLYSGGTATSLTQYPTGTYSTYSVGINNNADTAGFYKATSGGSVPMSAFVRTGGTYYHLNDNGGAYGSCIDALNTSGQAVGWLQADLRPRPHAEVWTYTISGGSLTRPPTWIFSRATRCLKEPLSATHRHIPAS